MYPFTTSRSRKIASLFAFAIPLLFSNCESALSDVEVTDPGVLQTHFIVERALLDDGTVLQSLHTTIYDKNFGSVELKNGHIRVNGQEMSVTEILNISTYYIPGATVNLNAGYEFEMVLANGETHTGSVTTQAKTFTSVTVPESSSVDNDLTISWEDAHVHDVFTISVALTSPAGTVPGPIFTLTEAQMQEGSFVIPKSTFATPEGITSANITLSGARYGTIDPEFRSGSATISRMRAEKKVTFD